MASRHSRPKLFFADRLLAAAFKLSIPTVSLGHHLISRMGARWRGKASQQRRHQAQTIAFWEPEDRGLNFLQHAHGP